MLTLYHSPKSRSSGFIWLLEESGAPYDIHYVNIRRVDGSGGLEKANPHPHGKVPLLKDGDAIIFEQIAIALYVSDKFPDAKLGPAVGDPGRGAYLTALAYYAGVTEPSFTSKFMNVVPPRGMAGWVAVDEVMEHINSRLARTAYIAGDDFTAADILYGGAFAMFMNSPLLEGYRTKTLEDYVTRCTSRPALARARLKDEAPS